MSTKKLPVYQLGVDEKEGNIVDAIALVDDPAIMSNFLKFKNQTPKPLKFAVNEERRELLGAAMIPDMEIYRRDEDTGEEYNIVFTKEVVRQTAQIFMKKGYQLNLNLQHTDVPAKSFIFQSFIVDPALGIGSPSGLDLPPGSWVIGVKVDDPATWDEVKSGRANGFSVEGLFLMAKLNTEKSNTFVEILKELYNLEKLLK